MPDPSDAFSACYRRELAFVERTLLCLGVARSEVDDAVQEVFLVLYRRWHELDPDLPVRTWLYAVARRVSGNRRRARSRQKTESVEALAGHHPLAHTTSPTPLPDDQLATKQALLHLQTALKRLPPARRVVFLLTEFDNLTAAEVALLVRCPRNTVSSQLRVARHEVRSHLARHLKDELAPSEPPSRARQRSRPALRE
jgi:RNA polymerase sigma-70 factor (ECF subfamily)